VRAPRLSRAALVLLCVAALAVGVPAALAPSTFYSDFPFFAHWVNLIPPYNQHLVTDVGGLYLGFAVLFAWAARTMQPTLVRAASVAWLVPALLHLGFHATHLHGFSTADAIAELASLTYLAGLALLALWGASPRSAD
jgi:hypothetical protein